MPLRTRRRSRRVRVFFTVVMACGAIALFALIGARHLVAWLSVSDPLQPADAIVVLGDDPTRAFEAADLYRAGLAPRILLSRPRRRRGLELLAAQGISIPWFEETARKVLLKEGVPMQAIDSFGEQLISTATEAEAIRDKLPDARRLIIVSSPYHLRRARIIFRNALPGVDIRMAGNHYEDVPTAWWTDQESAKNVQMEVEKLIFYELGGRMR